MHLQLARALGAAKLFATDIRDYRVKAACSLGADLALRADAEVVDKIRAANAGGLVDHVIVCTAATSAMHQALELVDRGGSVMFFAPMAPGGSLSLPMHDLWKRGVSILHSYAGPLPDMRTCAPVIAP